MLKFFRTIRKKLIEEDNVRKYLLYAIGEILLVVIGILIALQVNNWNELRKASELKKALLTNVQNDLRGDLDQLIIVRNDIIEKDKLGMYLMSYFNSDKDVSDFDVNKLRLGFMNALDVEEFSPNQLGYEELLSTGMVNKIKDDSLKTLLFDHYEVSVRETFDFRQRERYDAAVADGRFAYIPNLALREKIKTTFQMLDWKKDPYEDFNLDWGQIRSEGEFATNLGRLLALHLLNVAKLDQTEKNIHKMIAKITTEIEER